MSAPVNRMPFDEGSFLDVKNPDLMQRVAMDLYRGDMVKNLHAEMRTRDQLAAAAKVEYAARDGWCEEYVAEVPREAYYYWATREGPDVWRDPFFVKGFLRDNPQCRRITKTGRTVITNPGLPWVVPKPAQALLDASGTVVDRTVRRVLETTGSEGVAA
jgi:hypothetical protein